MAQSDSPDPIMDALRRLESKSDAKCNSTFCRFEDFVYGTGLSDEARELRGELQKSLVRSMWSEASARAQAVGATQVSAELTRQVMDDRLPRTTTSVGDVVLTIADGSTVTVSRVRLRQYSSIAYSLRAILAVQQDNLFFGEQSMLALEPDAVGVLKEASDLATLATLMVADEQARRDNQKEVSGPALRAAWERIVGAGPGDGAERTAALDGRLHAIDVIKAMVEEKLAAYEVYNDIPRDQIGPLLLMNMQRFYARYPVPQARENRDLMLTTVNYTVDVFTDELLMAAGEVAMEHGREIIRKSDADAAVQQLTPHEIDDFEDAHFFYRLGDEAVTLEAYDTDSLRDLGLHWWFLGRAYNNPNRSYLPVDPFAAEVITEAVSQYVVLLSREAGEVARENKAAPVLLRSDFGEARARIAELARRHHEAPEVVAPDTTLRSAKELGAGSDAFFADVTPAMGVGFTHRSSVWLGEFRRNRMEGPPTFSGGGVAAEDVNRDGRIDLVFVGGGGNAVYLGAGDGTFRDVTSEAGINWTREDGTFGEARQPIIADFDNDGAQDILITYANDAHRLYRGVGDGQFEDVTPSAGLGGQGLIGGPATVFDFDNDGLLDIYVCCFGNYLDGTVPTQDRDNRNAQANVLLHNEGGLKFVDVTEGSGTADTGWAQAVSHLDFDLDGDQDIFIANDFGRNALLENEGNGVFSNVGAKYGFTPAYHSMNVGLDDVNGDDRPDIYVSNIAMIVKDNKYVLPDPGKPLNFRYDKMATLIVKESNILWTSEVKDGVLTGYAPSTHIERGESSTGWAWDAEFFDFDLDGDDDLYVLNGANEYLVFATQFQKDESNPERPAWHHLNHDREANVFYANQDGVLRNVSSQSGANFTGNSRSAVYVDWDQDGDLDIAINNFHAPATMLENRLKADGRHWLKIRLVGDPEAGCNRDAIGARVVVTTEEGQRTTRYVQGGSGFLSMEPRLLHVGLGTAERAALTIVWPNGDVQVIEDVRSDQAVEVRQAG